MFKHLAGSIVVLLLLCIVVCNSLQLPLPTATESLGFPAPISQLDAKNRVLKAISEKYSNQLKTMIGTLNKMIEDQSALGDGFIVASFKGNVMHQVDCQKYGSAVYQVLKAHYNRHGYQTMYSCKVSGDVEGYCMINIRINFVEQ
ncbi:predicted protein [Naegleria gruberi]|uniref:Predicted protein n=1 Tax=Naegleria gruberi TaxID=5762 RepID=D2VSA9_NAEGR|nr:uncharacterized protein NAEGRDRAFT_71875 [Naegleria gruberi]EFC40311.1 predicted protein [Naegleria gruberi]|eukprot:XP_002673055.1 predicted protein [Naegleria gruberi strain NEG-M]